MTDWKLAAQAQGVALSEAQVQVLEAVETGFRTIREGLDWPDEPALEFHVQID